MAEKFSVNLCLTNFVNYRVEIFCLNLQDEYYSDRLPGTGHTCDECLKTFSSPGKLKQHEYSHTGETPFECKISGMIEKNTFACFDENI